MENLVVKEFYLTTVATFAQPVLKTNANISEVVDELLNAEYLKGMLNPDNIQLIAADELLRYTLRISLLEGLIILSLNSHGLTLTYTKGTTSNNLINVISLFEKITVNCMKGRSSQLQIISGIHGSFSNPEGFKSLVQPFADSSLAISGGGYILAGDGSHFIGSIRLVLEPSLTFEYSMFVQAIAFTSEEWKGDLMARIEKRVAEVLQARGYSLTFNEQGK